MGILDKVMFWKKDEAAIPTGLNSLPPLPGENNMGFGQQEPGYGQQMASPFSQQFGQQRYAEPALADNELASFKPSPAFTPVGSVGSSPLFGQQSPMQSIQPMQNTSDIIASKNLEVISSKLDALSAQLESVSQRLQNIERVALAEEKKSHDRRW